MAIDVSTATSHFTNPQDGFTTTTSGSVSSGASTVGLNSTGDYTNGDLVVLIIDPADSDKKQVFMGTIDTSGTQVTNVIWVGGTNQSHGAGSTVVDYYDAAHIKLMTKGILVHADQDGTLKAGAVDNAAVLTNGVVTTAKLDDSAVSTAKLADDSVTSAKLNPTKSTDANGWTVFDYGNWKEYVQRFTVGSVSSLASLGVVSNSVGSYPAGVAPNTLHTTVTNGTADNNNASRFVMNAADQSSASAGAALSISVRNVTGSTLSEANLVAVVRCIDR